MQQSPLSVERGLFLWFGILAVWCGLSGVLVFGGHADETGVEYAEDIDEVMLGLHDLLDVFIDEGAFVDAASDEFYAIAIEFVAHHFVIVGLEGLAAGHEAACTVGGGRERGGIAASCDYKGWGGHRAGNNAELAFGGGGSAFAVDDEFLAVVLFFPSEVVVIFDGEGWGDGKGGGEAAVDMVMTGGGVIACEVHGLPIFEAFGFVEVEPREVGYFFGEVAFFDGNLFVVFGDLGAEATRAGMGEDSEVSAFGELPLVGVGEVDGADIYEVIAAAAGADLLVGFILEAAEELGGGEFWAVDNGVFAEVVGEGIFAEAGVVDEDFFELGAFFLDKSFGIGVELIDGEAHTAGDVHADAVRDNCILGSENAADGEAVAVMGIGHECASDRDGELHGAFHLLAGSLVDAIGPEERELAGLEFDVVGGFFGFADNFEG